MKPEEYTWTITGIKSIPHAIRSCTIIRTLMLDCDGTSVVRSENEATGIEVIGAPPGYNPLTGKKMRGRPRKKKAKK